jgi:hypothetical protein
MTKALLLLHFGLAVPLVGAAVHNGMVSFRRLRGRRIAERLVCSYARVSALLCLGTVLLGALLYPSFRTDVRPQFDMELPLATLLFEIKEHVALTTTALLVTQAGLRRGPALGGRLADWLGLTAAGGVLFAGAVGAWLVTLDAP